MRQRLLVITLLLSAAALAVPTAGAAPAAKAKKCKKGFVHKKGRCVCPKGKVRHGSKCRAKKKATAKPTPTPTPTTPTPAPAPPSGGLTGQAAIDKFHQLITGSRFERVTGSANLSSQSTTRFSYCADGTSFVYYSESIGTYTSSTENANGTYTIVKAAFNPEGPIGEADVKYTATPGDTSIGASGEGIVRLTQNIAYIGGIANEFQWAANAAGC